MLPTPNVPASLPESVYPPSEDTYLMLDVLSSEEQMSFLHQHFESSPGALFFADVGTGSGTILAFIIAHASKLIGRSDVFGIGIDVSPEAAQTALQTVNLTATDTTGLKSPADTTLSDLTSALRPRSLDLLVCNPPYVPSESVPPWSPVSLGSAHGRDRIGTEAEDEFARTTRMLEVACAGGPNGMAVTKRLLSVELSRVLSPRGVAYLLLCRQNDPEEVVRWIQSLDNDVLDEHDDNRSSPKMWDCEIVGTSGKTAGWEKLFIIRVMRTNSKSKP